MAQTGLSSSECIMSYNNKKATLGTYLVYLEASSTSVSVGDTINYSVSTGTSGHGVTASNGVISLPAGEWICYASVEADSLTNSLEAKWYVDNVLNTDFPHIVHTKYGTGSGFSTDMYTSAITLEGGVDVELRVTSSDISNQPLGNCDLVIYGVRT
jgi:cytochrome bd-type quinol oxidase subunit 1